MGILVFFLVMALIAGVALWGKMRYYRNQDGDDDDWWWWEGPDDPPLIPPPDDPGGLEREMEHSGVADG